MKSISFSTLSRNYGPVRRADACTETEWQQALRERRFMTVYHGESDWSTPVLGVVNHHGCVNTLCKLVFAKPLPAEYFDEKGEAEVNCMRNSDAAFQLCNP